jgi:hypothetical protein
METTGDEEPEMYEEITPKEYQADRKDCKDAEEISQQDRTMGSVDNNKPLQTFRSLWTLGGLNRIIRGIWIRFLR